MHLEVRITVLYRQMHVDVLGQHDEIACQCVLSISGMLCSHLNAESLRSLSLLLAKRSSSRPSVVTKHQLLLTRSVWRYVRLVEHFKNYKTQLPLAIIEDLILVDTL